MKIEIKMGRKIETFTEDDLFLDNGRCVQCMTNYGFRAKHSTASWLMMTKKAIKILELSCDRIYQHYEYGDECKVFKLKLKTYTTASRKHRYRIVSEPKMHPLKKLLTMHNGVEFWDTYLLRWSESIAVFQSDLIELTAEEKAAL